MSLRLHPQHIRGFTSDNHSGAHPDVLAALTEANGGHQPAYGADLYTARLSGLVAELFGPQAAGYPVFNGTGANLVGLQAILPRWGSVICPESAHINTDEAGAAEHMAGIKLITLDTTDGKLRPADLRARTPEPGDVHHPLPAAVSITQATELGTVYGPDEIAAVADWAHRYGLRVHMDGARIANAAAALGMPLRALTTDAGVDVLSFGGTKNGLVFGEMVIALTPAAAAGTERLRKMSMQLASKMRFVSAQLIALFEDDLWWQTATHANRMAGRLNDAVSQRIETGRLPGVGLSQPVEANIVFATLPDGVADRLRKHVDFHDWNTETGQVRWVCSFDTTSEDVDGLVDALEAEVTASGHEAG